MYWLDKAIWLEFLFCRNCSLLEPPLEFHLQLIIFTQNIPLAFFRARCCSFQMEEFSPIVALTAPCKFEKNCTRVHQIRCLFFVFLRSSRGSLKPVQWPISTRTVLYLVRIHESIHELKLKAKLKLSLRKGKKINDKLILSDCFRVPQSTGNKNKCLHSRICMCKLKSEV